MLVFAVRRIVTAVMLLLLLTLITFVIFYRIPAEPGRILVGEKAPMSKVREANHKLGADRPLPEQYGMFLWRLVRGDLGVTWDTVGDPQGEQHVRPLLLDSAGVTASVLIGGVVLLILIAVPLGSLAALREGTPLDRLSTVAVIACVSLPPAVVGLLLKTFVARELGLAPQDGYCNLVPHGVELCGGFHDWAAHLILPWLTFALFFGALYMGMTRTRMINELGQPYVRTARAKGAGELRVVGRHALRNAILPLVTMLAMDVGTALGISVYVETVFGLPGLGSLWLHSLGGQIGGFDLPVILGLVVFTGLIVIVANLAVDLLYGVIDPRVREAGSVRATLVR
ncbi:MAG: ABC transporter permease [Gaiellales bacterium]|jgi:peptide/nickel transport system permease protein|nr:ABC transporter permease [Gaiellales bacterium]